MDKSKNPIKEMGMHAKFLEQREDEFFFIKNIRVFEKFVPIVELIGIKKLERSFFLVRQIHYDYKYYWQVVFIKIVIFNCRIFKKYQKSLPKFPE